MPVEDTPEATGGATASAQTKDERMWGMLCHLSALSLYVGIPFGNLIGPLVIWLIKKDEFPFVDENGRESLNFQISLTIYLALTIPLIFVVVGIPILILLALAGLVLVIVASIQASDGKSFRYPYTFRLIK